MLAIFEIAQSKTKEVEHWIVIIIVEYVHLFIFTTLHLTPQDQQRSQEGLLIGHEWLH